MEERFDEKFPIEGGDSIYRFYRLDFPKGESRSIKAFIKSELTSFFHEILEKKKLRGVPHQWEAIDVEDILAIAKERGIELHA